MLRNWGRAVDLQADDLTGKAGEGGIEGERDMEEVESIDMIDREIDAELTVWASKQAEEQGLTPEEARRQEQERELEHWKQWKVDPTPESFQQLYDSHAKIFGDVGKQYKSQSTLPRAAIKSNMLYNYIQALHTFDPAGGRKLSTHVIENMQHTRRYITRYRNIAKIPHDRGKLVGLFDNRYGALKESLGREPTNQELADDMLTSGDEVAKNLTARTVGTLRKERQRELMAEAPGGDVGQTAQDTQVADRIKFLYGNLNPEQQLVLEHMFPDWGRPVIDDPQQLAPVIGMSPQKIRAIKKQIGDRLTRKGY